MRGIGTDIAICIAFRNWIMPNPMCFGQLTNRFHIYGDIRLPRAGGSWRRPQDRSISGARPGNLHCWLLWRCAYHKDNKEADLPHPTKEAICDGVVFGPGNKIVLQK